MAGQVADKEEEIHENIAAQVSLRANAWYGPNAELLPVREAIRRHRYSFFFRFQIKAGSQVKIVLVKVPRKQNMTLATATNANELRKSTQDEYHTLQATWEIFKNSKDENCHAIEPLAYLEEWNAIVMPEISGVMLKDVLFRPSVILRSSAAWLELQRNLIHTARWLRIFHEGGDMKMETFPRQDAQEQIEVTLEALKKNSRGRVNIEPLQRAMKDFLDKAAAEPVPVTLLHKNFEYSSVIIMPDGRACALDPHNPERGAIYMDLAALLVDPDTRFAQVLSYGCVLSERRLQDSRQKFLNAYFKDSSLEPVALNFYCALRMIRKWGYKEHIFSASRPVRIFVAPFLLPIIRRHFARILQYYLGSKI